MEAAGATLTKTPYSMIAHPVRVQILAVTSERPISPTRYVEQVMGIDQDERPDDFKRGLSHVSYHFKELAKYGYIEVVELIPKRGSVEHVYRAVTRAEFTDEEFADLPDEEKREIMGVAWRGLVTRTEAAQLAQTLHDRDGSSLAWTDAHLDERGWAEMATTLDANFGELEQIRKEAEARLAEQGAEGVPVTFAVMGYERPSGVFYDALPQTKPGNTD